MWDDPCFVLGFGFRYPISLLNFGREQWVSAELGFILRVPVRALFLSISNAVHIGIDPQSNVGFTRDWINFLAAWLQYANCCLPSMMFSEVEFGRTYRGKKETTWASITTALSLKIPATKRALGATILIRIGIKKARHLNGTNLQLITVASHSWIEAPENESPESQPRGSRTHLLPLLMTLVCSINNRPNFDLLTLFRVSL